jgi:anti-sigma factor RsiW
VPGPKIDLSIYDSETALLDGLRAGAHKHDYIARCQELLGQLNAYVDGDLGAALCHDLELHLADCPDCRVVFDTLAKTITLYHTLDTTPVALPADVEARLLRRLNLPSSALIQDTEIKAEGRHLADPQPSPVAQRNDPRHTQ